MNACARCMCVALVLSTICAAAQNRNPEWTLVLHADESTGNVWLASGMADQNGDLSHGMSLVRLHLGQPEPFFKDGIAYNTSLYCGYGDGSICLQLGYELNALFESLGWGHNFFGSGPSIDILSNERGTNLGECAGYWTWANDGPLCAQGRPARPRPLAEEWQGWSDRQRLDLLLYMQRNSNRFGQFPAAPTLSSGKFCNISSPPEERRDCPPWAEFFADPIISVARNVRPLPEIPDTARAHMLNGSAIFQAGLKTPKDADDAAGEFSGAIAAAPWWRDAYYNRARAETYAGFCRRAYIDFERVLKLRPSPEDASDVRARMQQLPCHE